MARGGLRELPYAGGVRVTPAGPAMRSIAWTIQKKNTNKRSNGYKTCLSPPAHQPQASITPEPISSPSGAYHAANWPAVTPLCGSAKSTTPQPFSSTRNVACCSGCR